jgi:MFS family permease
LIRRLFRIELADQVENRDVQRGLVFLLYEGVCSQLMDTLTSGAFLVAFALLMGASNTVVGLLAAISPITQLFQVPAIYVVDRAASRKTLVVLSSFLSRISWLVVAIIPWLVPSDQRVDVLLICLFLYFGLGTLSSCGFNPWIRDFVPEKIMGRYFGKRMAIGTAAASVLALLAGVGIELGKWYVPSEFVPYSVLFLLGGSIGLSGVYFLSQVPEPKVTKPRPEGMFESLGQPLRDHNFRRLLIFLGVLFFAINLSGPFYAVYMIKRLDMSMALVIGLAVLSQMMSVISFRFWGKAADNFTNKSALIVSGYIYIVSVLIWPFLLISDNYFFMIPVLVIVHMLTGISAAGVNLCTANIALKAAPRGKATSFLAVNTLVHGVTAATAPILGGIIADNLTGLHSLFYLTAIIGLYSMRCLRTVHEEGEVKGRIVVTHLLAEARKAVRSLFTSSRVRRLPRLPSAPAEQTVRRPKPSLGVVDP